VERVSSTYLYVAPKESASEVFRSVVDKQSIHGSRLFVVLAHRVSSSQVWGRVGSHVGRPFTCFLVRLPFCMHVDAIY